MSRAIVQHRLSGRIYFKILTCLGLVVFFDFLFLFEKSGWTIGLFGLSAGLVLCLFEIPRASHRVAWLPIAGTLVFGISQILQPSPIGLVLMWSSIVSIPLLYRSRFPDSVLDWAIAVTSHFAFGLIKPAKDLILINKVRKRRPVITRLPYFQLVAVPLALTAVFLFLFAGANPVLGLWLEKIDPMYLFDHLSLPRVLIWVAIFAAMWGLLRQRRTSKLNLDFGFTDQEPDWFKIYLSPQTTLISLALFNTVFLFQNLSDLVFLWSGHLLPEGLSYADYAHKGAYLLIITALLAAGFVLLTFRTSKTEVQSPLLKGLVYLWIAQNGLLVASSFERTMSYIEIYSLTGLRLSALFWMALVAIGLLLIVLRIHLHRSNTWLMNWNAAVLGVVLTLLSFSNSSSMIAWYNVKHAQEISGTGVPIDLQYLENLGPSALPALSWLQKNLRSSPKRNHAVRITHQLEIELHDDLTHWRSWTVQKWQLERQQSTADQEAP